MSAARRPDTVTGPGSPSRSGARRWSRRAVLRGALSLVYLLAVLEGGMRVAVHSDFIFSRMKGRDDSSHRISWVRRYSRNQQVDLKFDVHHPVRGWALEPDIRAMEVFDGEVLNSNARGLRGGREHPYEPVSGRRRILVLGDSYTFGEEVSDGETYAAVLDDLLPEADVLNLGVHAYGHDQMWLYLRDEGVRSARTSSFWASSGSISIAACGDSTVSGSLDSRLTPATCACCGYPCRPPRRCSRRRCSGRKRSTWA